MVIVKPKKFPAGMSHLISELVHCGMGKSPRLARRRIWINEWIAAIPGATQAEAAEAAGVSQPYLSNMGRGHKSNPSARIMLAISEYLGISVNDLYRSPPSQAAIESLGGLSPAARDVLLRQPKPQK